MEIVWKNVLVLLIYHYVSLEGLFYMVTLRVKWQTILFFFFLRYASITGITAGVHRLWAHRSYKARLPLRILLCVFYTIALQGSIHVWVRDHRVHHKYSDTDADPHNASRGFFFSHMGWLMVRKHPEVLAKGKTMNLSDLEEDPVVTFQEKYYAPLGITLCFVLPTIIPWYFWNEDLYVAFTTAGMLRYLLTLHYTWLVNSVAHTFGYKPYDKNIKSSENRWVSYITQGEGWHNYHHAFPWDYKAAELSTYSGNVTTAFIDFMAKIGWAYELKAATKELVNERILRTGIAS